MIYIGADHRGFKAKEALLEYLQSRGYAVADVGTRTEEPVDYPIIAEKVGHKVTEDPNNRGVLLCASGAGVCIAVNKIDGIRAAEAWNENIARSVRTDDNINVLCLSAEETNTEDMKKITQIFLDTSFVSKERYKRRLKEIQDMEKEN